MIQCLVHNWHKWNRVCTRCGITKRDYLMNQHETEAMRRAQESQQMSTPKCIIEGCRNIQARALNNGLCMMCHSKAKKAIESGVVTKEELIALGLMIDNIATTDPFTIALQKKLEGDNSAGG